MQAAIEDHYLEAK